MKTRTILGVLTLLALPATLHAVAAQDRGGGGRGGGGRGGAPAEGPARGRGEPAPPSTPAPEDDVSTFFFQTADWDGDGWIRFSEAEKSMGLDLDEFGVYDRDNDGLIDAIEFTTRYNGIIARGGVFTPPRPKPDAPRAKKRDGKALLAAYDADSDGMLSELELTRAMTDASIQDPTPIAMMTTLDKDRSLGVDGLELEELSRVLFPNREAPTEKPRLTLVELFDRSIPKDTRAGTTMGPRRTIGPIPVFRRLDYDRSGGIELSDLEALQRPLRSIVRPAAILATLDTDGNGTISAEEFAASMQ